MPLSNRDKTPNPSGFGFTFHHTEPQRRFPCTFGDMIVPLSADDIPPISPEAMASVQAALALLADFVSDPDFARFLGDNEERQAAYRVQALDIRRAAQGLAAILRVQEAP